MIQPSEEGVETRRGVKYRFQLMWQGPGRTPVVFFSQSGDALLEPDEAREIGTKLIEWAALVEWVAIMERGEEPTS